MCQPLLIRCVFTVDEAVDLAPDETIFLFTTDGLGRAIDCADGALLAMGPSPVPEATFGLAVVIDADMGATLEVTAAVLRSGST